VIGGGDWAKDRLIPDLIHSFMTKQPLEIRYPKAVRPWQYVLEPLSGYLLLAKKLMQDPQTFQSAWNFGPNDKGAKEVLWIVKKMALLWGEDANWTINQNQNPHEAKNLKLDITKAKEILGWHPIVGLNYALESIVRFHRAHQASENIKKYCLDQIEEFERISDTKIDIG
jgi:CDP-glucose 4,6-dehydratase